MTEDEFETCCKMLARPFETHAESTREFLEAVEFIAQFITVDNKLIRQARRFSIQAAIQVDELEKSLTTATPASIGEMLQHVAKGFS